MSAIRNAEILAKERLNKRTGIWLASVLLLGAAPISALAEPLQMIGHVSSLPTQISLAFAKTHHDSDPRNVQTDIVIARDRSGSLLESYSGEAECSVTDKLAERTGSRTLTVVPPSDYSGPVQMVYMYCDASANDLGYIPTQISTHGSPVTFTVTTGARARGKVILSSDGRLYGEPQDYSFDVRL
jgi:hypothetical protein